MIHSRLFWKLKTHLEKLLLKTGRLRLFGQTFQFLDKTKDDDDDGIFSPFFNKQEITLLTCDSSNTLK